MSRSKLALLLASLALPTLTLIPLGSLWLWQHGMVLPWVAGALVVTAFMYVAASSLVRSPSTFAAARSATSMEGMGVAERAAWAAIDKLSETIDPAAIRSRTDILDIAARTVGVVAREFHPTDKTPVWNFTVPELLLLTERVSGRLRPVFIDTIPFAEQLSIAQVLRLYEWRSLAGVADTAYDIWRLLRVVNPVAAVTQEARERVTKQIIASLRNDVTHRLIRLLVREIGSGAIDLYSGRLRMADADSKQTTLGLGGKSEIAQSPTRFGRVWREARKMGKSASALYRRKQNGRKID